MKTITAIAAIMLATSATADVIRSNVPAMSGAVPGFFVDGHGYFVAEGYEDRATVAATVVPASVDVKDQGEVAAYLAGLGINQDFRIQGVTNSFVTVEVSPGVFERQSIRQGLPAYQQRW